jgi:hypothetical protein
MRRLLMLLVISQAACAQNGGWRVTVLANSIDSGMASDFYSFLQSQGISPVKADAKTFDILKDSANVVILGGQNSPEGVGAVSAAILSQAQQGSLLMNGSSGAFSREGVFAAGQKLYIFAGNEAPDTRRAWQDNKERLAAQLTGGLRGLKITAPQSLLITPKNNILSINFPVNASNYGPSNLSRAQVMAFLNGGIRLQTDPTYFDLLPGESSRVLIRLNPRNVSSGDVVSVTFGGSEAKTVLNVTEYERVPVCNVCAAADVK